MTITDRLPVPESTLALPYVGQQFGSLTVEAIALRAGEVRCHCECVCGLNLTIPAAALVAGEVTTCEEAQALARRPERMAS